MLFSADQQTNYLCLRPNYLCLRLSCVVFFFLGICSTVLTQYALNGGIVHKYFWCLGGTLVCKQAHFWRSGFKGNPSVRALQIFGRGGHSSEPVLLAFFCCLGREHSLSKGFSARLKYSPIIHGLVMCAWVLSWECNQVYSVCLKVYFLH